MTGLTWEQYVKLCEPLDTHRVSEDPRGNSHLEQWDVRRHLIRFFGFGGWDFEVKDCVLVKEIEHPPTRKKNRNGEEYGDPYVPWTVIYRVLGRLVIKDEAGNVFAHYDDGATGDAHNQPNLGDAHDQALKTALSQALKRCAVNLGDQFGLGLYSKTTDPVVYASVVHPAKPAERAS